MEKRSRSGCFSLRVRLGFKALPVSSSQVSVGGQSGRRGGSDVGVSGRRRFLCLKNGGAAVGSASVALTPAGGLTDRLLKPHQGLSSL